MQRPMILGTVVLTVGCGGASRPDDASSLMSETTAGQDRCVSAGGDEKLFVVDWDATDASTFQARAARDVVFVRYESCNMQVIEGCSDGSLAGRYGSYRTPVFTSGARDAFSIETQDDLRARLPLGVATLGAELSSQRALELTYHVAGTALATRDEVYQAELADNPRCAEATHAVVAYNLGAFRLQTKDRDVQAGGLEGVVEGGSSRKRAALREAGDLEACSEVANFACRVPIRLTLRPIKPGTPPAPVANAPQVPLPPSQDPNLQAAQKTMSAVQIEGEARRKLMAHDGAGCLADLDRADRVDPQGRNRRLQIRAMCAFRAGRCEEGKNFYRQSRRAFWQQAVQNGADLPGAGSDALIENEVNQMVAQECATAQGGGKSVGNASIDLLKSIMAASQQKDAAACVRQGNELMALHPKPPTTPNAETMGAAGGLKMAAECAAAGGKCAEAKKLYAHSLRFLGMGDDPATVDSAFAQNVKGCAK